MRTITILDYITATAIVAVVTLTAIAIFALCRAAAKDFTEDDDENKEDK